MSLNKETVSKVARLARIRLTPEEEDLYAPQLSNLMQWIEQLAEVDTDNVAPLASVVDVRLSLRPDAVTDGDKQPAILANAPETTEGFFVVPKVVE